MKMNPRSIMTVVLMAMWTVSVAPRAAENPFVGSWKKDVAKSAAASASSPDDSVMRVEAHDGGIRVIRELAGSKGESGRWEYIATFDGKDSPIANDPHRDSIAFQQIDSHTLQAINKKDGKVTSSPRWAVSKDGQTLTISWQDKNAQGEPINNVRIYNRQ